MISKLEPFFFRIPFGLMSRIRISFYKFFGLIIGKKNRIESGRIRRLNQISIGNNNAISQGWQLWPEDTASNNIRIKIGSNNYFNRNVMIDACGYIEIGDFNMFGPDIYLTDSNHAFGNNLPPSKQPMQIGKVKIGNYCWIGAKAVILKDVELGDYCVVAAGAVVTKSFPKGSVVAGVPAKMVKTIEIKH